MIAAVQDPESPKALPCVVYWTGRKGLSVKVKAWCGETYDASDGVIQIPDDTPVCQDCERAIKSRKPNL